MCGSVYWSRPKLSRCKTGLVKTNKKYNSNHTSLSTPTPPQNPHKPSKLHTGEYTLYSQINPLKRHIRRLKRQGITYKDTIAQLPITIHIIHYTTFHTVHISPYSGSCDIPLIYSQCSSYTLLYPCSIMLPYRILTLLYAIKHHSSVSLPSLTSVYGIPLASRSEYFKCF